jgi:peptidoglycan/xylan/chitin deacetylase (PgdA/CDA1 family)
MGTQTFKRASELCEVGAHGATHTDLTSLRPEALEEELSASKAYLETLSGKQVTTMSAPGGKIDRRVVRAALKLGFGVVGDSKALLNTTPSLPLHRVCMLNGQSPEYVLSLARAGSIYWLRKRLRWMAASVAARALGDEGLEAVKRTFKGDRPG